METRAQLRLVLGHPQQQLNGLQFTVYLLPLLGVYHLSFTMYSSPFTACSLPFTVYHIPVTFYT